MPSWVYAIIVISAFSQLVAWILFLKQLLPKYQNLTTQYSKPANWLILFSGIAVSIKFLLQAASTIPSISTLAFGFRPIVIAYFHWILLGVITLFLIANFLSSKLVPLTKNLLAGIIIFVFGIIFNECLLMSQGVAAILENSILYINEWLLFAAFLLFLGMSLLNLGIKKIK